MEKNDKRYGITVVKFTLVGLGIGALLSFCVDFGVQHSNDSQTGKVNKIMNHSIDPNIIVFGASSGEVGIDPAILTQKTGLTAFNCSIDGTRFQQYNGLINEFESYSRDNKLAVLVEAYFTFEKIDALNSIERYMPHINKDNVYHSLFMVQPDLAWKCRYVPFYKYIAVTHVYYKNAVYGWENYLLHREDSSSGYIPVDRPWEGDADAGINDIQPFAIQMDSGLINTYIKTVENIRRRGRKVVILLTPMIAEMNNKITNMDAFRNELSSIAKQTGVCFLDFSKSPACTDKNLFYNRLHLNRRGSEFFSAILGDSLKNILAK